MKAKILQPQKNTFKIEAYSDKSQFLQAQNFSQTVPKSKFKWNKGFKQSPQYNLLNQLKANLQKINQLSQLQIQFQANLSIYLILQKYGIDIYRIQSLSILRLIISNLVLNDQLQNQQHTNYNQNSVQFDRQINRRQNYNIKKPKLRDYANCLSNSKIVQNKYKRLLCSSTQKSTFKHFIFPKKQNIWKQTEIYIDLEYNNKVNQYKQTKQKCQNCEKLNNRYSQMIGSLQNYILQKQQSIKDLQMSIIGLQSQLAEYNANKQNLNIKLEQSIKQIQKKQNQLKKLRFRINQIQKKVQQLQYIMEQINNSTKQTKNELENYKIRQKKLKHKNSLIQQKCIKYQKQIQQVNQQHLDEVLRRCLYTQALSIQGLLN